jgi:hypothetical protein
MSRAKENAAHTKGKEQQKMQENTRYAHRKITLEINQKTIYVSATG